MFKGKTLALGQKGFTMVELMIATSVFSVIMVVVTAGVINFSAQYQKGIVGNTTQTVARNSLSEITQSIQFSGSDVWVIPAAGSGDGTKGWCINGQPYFFLRGKQMGIEVNHALVTSKNACSIAVPQLSTLNFSGSGLTNPRELLGDRMRLLDFDVQNRGAGVMNVTLKIAYGDDDLFCAPSKTGSCEQAGNTIFNDGEDLNPPADVRCRSGQGNQYCSVVGLNSDVSLRLGQR